MAVLAHASPNTIEPEEISVEGMMSASLMKRVRKVSEHLRKHMVMTEWPIYCAKLKTFPNDDTEGPDQLPIKELNQQLCVNYLDELQNYFDAQPGALLPDGTRKGELSAWQIIGRLGIAQKVLDGLQQMEFGVMYRAMISNVRLSELMLIEGKQQLGNHIAEAMCVLAARDLSGFAFEKRFRELDPASAEDRRAYLVEVLPNIIAENLAHFHGAGCFHKYLHPGNFTIAGEIVDLDSVRCNTLFDEDIQVGTEQFTCDLNWAMASVHDIYTRFFREDVDMKTVMRRMVGSYAAIRMIEDNCDDAERLLLDSKLGLTLTEMLEVDDTPLVIGDDKIINTIFTNKLAECRLAADHTSVEEIIKDLYKMCTTRAEMLVRQYFESQHIQITDITIASVAMQELNRMFVKYRSLG